MIKTVNIFFCDICGKKISEVKKEYGKMSNFSYDISADQGGSTFQYKDICGDCQRALLKTLDELKSNRT